VVTTKKKVEIVEDLPVKRKSFDLADAEDFRMQAEKRIESAVKEGQIVLGTVKDDETYEAAISAALTLKKALDSVSRPYTTYVHNPIMILWQFSNFIRKTLLEPSKDLVKAIEHETGEWVYKREQQRKKEKAERLAAIQKQQEEEEAKRRLHDKWWVKDQERLRKIKEKEEKRRKDADDALQERALAAEAAGDPDADKYLDETPVLGPRAPEPAPSPLPEPIPQPEEEDLPEFDMPPARPAPKPVVAIPAVTTMKVKKVKGHSVKVKYHALIHSPLLLVIEIAAGRQSIDLIKAWDTVELDKKGTKTEGKAIIPGVEFKPEYDSSIRRVK